MELRKINYLLKGLPLEEKQAIFDKLRNGINPIMCRYFREKDEDYPSFRMSGYEDEDIEKIKETYRARFEEVNGMLKENGRAPVFTDPEDTYLSAVEYEDVMRLREEEELEEIFGSNFDDYVPEEYREEPESDFRLLSNLVRFGYGYTQIDGKRVYYAFHGYPNRNDDYYTTAEISLEEFKEIERDYPKQESVGREEAEVFREKYVNHHKVLLEGWEGIF